MKSASRLERVALMKENYSTLSLKVKEALTKDVGRGIARLDPEEKKALGLDVGEFVALEGKRKTVA